MLEASKIVVYFSFSHSHCLFLFYTVAAAILGGYGTLISLAVLRNKMKSKPEVDVAEVVSVEVPASTTDDSGIPPMDSPEFDHYLDTKGFFMLLENDSQLNALTESF